MQRICDYVQYNQKKGLGNLYITDPLGGDEQLIVVMWFMYFVLGVSCNINLNSALSIQQTVARCFPDPKQAIVANKNSLK